tara:strand:- start:1458 stop:1775 length:318 start_codon:yes stop_codon:yes gene_type:complete
MSSKYSPDHYKNGIETWDYIVSQELGYLEGNIIKYITRAGKKENESRLDDLLKAKAYLTKLISTELDDEESTGSTGTSDQVPEYHEPIYGGVQSRDYSYTDLFDR